MSNYMVNPMFTEPYFKPSKISGNSIYYPFVLNHQRNMCVEQHEIKLKGRVTHIPHLCDIVRNFYLVGGFIRMIRIQNGENSIIFSAENINARRGYLIPVSINLFLSQNNYNTTNIIIDTEHLVKCYAEYLYILNRDAHNKCFVKTKQSVTQYAGVNSKTYFKASL
jgi:hypothetical protein